MICKITGVLRRRVDDTCAVLEIGELEYEVLIPDFTRRHLESRLGTKVSLHTIQYLEGNPAHGRLVPRLIGFTNEAEKGFLRDVLLGGWSRRTQSVTRHGAAGGDVAITIEEQDAKALTTLPGIGAATAERIIAKLRRKMPKFALIAASHETDHTSDVERDIIEDTFQLLISLGHNGAEARKLIDNALGTQKKFKDVDALIKEVYRITQES